MSDRAGNTSDIQNHLQRLRVSAQPFVPGGGPQYQPGLYQAPVYAQYGGGGAPSWNRVPLIYYIFFIFSTIWSSTTYDELPSWQLLSTRYGHTQSHVNMYIYW